MDFEAVARALNGIPHMTREQGRILYDFVRLARPRDVLELGFAHGVSTCYIAAALQENGSGHVTTIDLEMARQRDPDIATLLVRTGLSEYVTPVFTPASYTWDLMKMIEEQSAEGACKASLDFCFIDGAHTWDPDGFAFFLVDKLLTPGGWFLFDDLNWTFVNSPSLKDSSLTAGLPGDYRSTPQVGKVFSLLVGQHPSYHNLRIQGEWGWAQKRDDSAAAARHDAPLAERVYTQRGVLDDSRALLRKIAARLLRRTR